MSFDIIILKPENLNVRDISEVEGVVDLGSSEEAWLVFEKVYPGIQRAPFRGGNGYFVELTLSGEPVESAHLTLRYGSSWGELDETDFMSRLSEACSSLGCVAFAVSDNTRVAP